MFYPDNFLYFISIFSISIFTGTYLLFSYTHNKLLFVNALLFLLCAIRACTEYYLPGIESYEEARTFAKYHSLPAYFFSIGMWYCGWAYVRPFQRFKKEKIYNTICICLVAIIPSVFFLYAYWTRKIFYFHPEQIDGYWQFSAYEGDLGYFHTLHLYFMLFLNLSIILLYLYSILTVKKHRFKKSFLLLFFIVIPQLFIRYAGYNPDAQWVIPRMAGFFLIHSLLLSWFFSDYRLFQNTFNQTVKGLLNSVSDLAVYTDLNFKISYANQLAQQQFSMDMTKGNDLIQVLVKTSGKTGQQIKDMLYTLILNEKKEEEIHLNISDLDKIFNIKVSKLEQSNSDIGYTFLLTDLTEIRQKEAKLQELNTTKDKFFAIIAHDLRRPALTFRGISKKVNYLIQKQEFATLNLLGEQLEKSAFSLNNLLDNLLNWALQQRNVLPYAPQSFDVEEATEEIYELFQPIAADKNIDLQFDISADTKIFTDINAFTTIVRNLLDNAIKYTPSDGLVQFKAVPEADEVKLNIIDNGVGIKKTNIPRLFDFQKNKSTQGTKGEKGSGLGLTLVRDLVELNKGTIRVWSEVSKGTIFEIILPKG